MKKYLFPVMAGLLTITACGNRQTQKAETPAAGTQACGERPNLSQGGGRHPDHHHAEDRTEGESHQGH